MTERASLETVEQVLRRVLAGMRLRRIPKNPEHRNIVLAILCLGLVRRHPYAEMELNDALRHELEKFNALVDHVTCRRYLVDLDFLKRDRAGHRYFVNFPKVESTLADDSLAGAGELPARLIDEIRQSPRGRHFGR